MINVLFFAKLREELNINELGVEFKSDIASIGDLYNSLLKDYPQIDNVKNIKAAVNQELIKKWDFTLKDGDEVAFFPPITGG